MPVSRWLLCGLLLAAGGALGAAEEAAPSLELLDFLGSFETADGQWVDPTQLEMPPSADERTDAGGQDK